MQKKSYFYVLLNHPLLKKQIQDIETLGKNIVYLPNELSALWKQIEIPVRAHIAPILDYLSKHVQKDDIVLVQGHTGATYIIVNHVRALGATAVYAHSPKDVTHQERILSEKDSVSLKHFEHIGFVAYGV